MGVQTEAPAERSLRDARLLQAATELIEAGQELLLMVRQLKPPGQSVGIISSHNQRHQHLAGGVDAHTAAMQEPESALAQIGPTTVGIKGDPAGLQRSPLAPAAAPSH